MPTPRKLSVGVRRIVFHGVEGEEVKVLMCVFVSVCFNFEMFVKHLAISLSNRLFLYL